MVIVTEVSALCSLLLQLTEFSAQIRDGLYKGSAELDEFPTKVAILSAKHAQWTSLLQKFGMANDEHLKHLIKAADQILDKERQYVRKLQSCGWVRFKRKAFPGQLTYILNSLVEIVDAGPELLEHRVETHDLLERSLGQTVYPLPFGPDRNYVPLLGSIREVQNALEDGDAPHVVILHGGPGMGKSSLVKYLALHYQNYARKQYMATASTTTCFPDGVFYLLCERGAQARINQLQMELLKSLGGGVGCLTSSKNPICVPEQEEEFMHIPSHHTNLRIRLAEQKVLIVLDDVWEEEVFEKLLVPGPGVRYLVTSQIRSIWRGDATIIGLKNPGIVEARRIMANFTEGLPIKGEFPDNIKHVTDAIIRRLDYHPQSLASVGITINRSKATDQREWETVMESIRDQFDEVDFYRSPPVYGTRYPLTVDASMMLMVNSLPPAARRLLFLMGLLEASEIPEVLVKFFFKFIQPIEPRQKYQRQIRYLDDRSLVELRCHSAYGIIIDEEDHMNRFGLATHGLRTYFIRKNHTVDVRSIATEIVSSGSGSSSNHGGQLIQGGSTEATLATIMGSMYFENSFRDVVAPNFQSQSRIFNADVIPRSISYEVDVLDLMNRARNMKEELGSLVWFLNPDGEGGWKQQAHEYAKKIVIRLVFRRELDDENMAQLIRLPQTTTTACGVLQGLVSFRLLDFPFVYHKHRTFSSVHGKTMKSLLCLLDDDAATAGKRAAGIAALGCVLEYESEDTILKVAKKWVEFLAKESNPTLQTAVARILGSECEPLSRGKLVVGEFPEVVDRLSTLMFEGKSSDVQRRSAKAIYALCRSSSIVSRIMTIPGALEGILDLSRDQQHLPVYFGDRAYYAGKLLCMLSCIPEKRVRFTTVHDRLKWLTEMLASKSRISGLPYFVTVAEIVGNLALTNDVRDLIRATVPEVEERLRFLQLSISCANCVIPTTPEEHEIFRGLLAISRALTILDPDATMVTVPPPDPWACFLTHMGRARGYMEMGLYSEALDAFNIADECSCLERFAKWSREQFVWWFPDRWCWEFPDDYRPLKIFLKTMVKDFAGAMLHANSVIEDIENLKEMQSIEIVPFVAKGERGVLKQLLGTDLSEALADFDEALADFDEHFEHYNFEHLLSLWKYESNPQKHQYGLLKHRGLVKHMMGDEVGARADGESALQLKHDRLVWEETRTLVPKYLVDLPVNYLGFIL